MFAGIGGFREGLRRAGGFECAGHCEQDEHAERSYRALFDTRGEWFCEDIRKADAGSMPDFELLCGGFPCQSFSIAGSRHGFADPRGTLFFELARVAETRKPQYLLFENVPGLLNHDGGRTFAAILDTLDGLGYGVEWQVLNSKDFDVPQARRRVYIVGYLDARCAGKILPFRETNDAAPAALRDGAQGSRVYDPAGVSCTLSANCGGFGGRTGLYDVSGGVPIKEATKKGYKMAYPGDSIDLAYPRMNTRRGRVGRQTAHTLTTDATQGTLEPRPVRTPLVSSPERNPSRTGKPGAPMFTLIRKLDQYVEQMRFLLRHGIDSREQLAEYRKPLLDEIAALTKERHGLYRSAPDSPRIGQITARLKVLRKESRMCGRIEKHSVEIGQRLTEARAEQKKYVENEKQKGADKAEKRRDALQRDGQSP